MKVDQSTEALGAVVVSHRPTGPRRGVIFAVVSVALFMSAMDQTIVATALPAIQDDLDAQINWSGWTITIYSLGQVLVLPLAGKISDTYGRKKVFLISVVIFTAASLCCGFANSIYLLVVLRAVQAVGGGAFTPSATGIVADHFGKDRDRALGLFSSIFPIGGIVGPLFGGLFVEYWSWRGIFLINVPLGIALLVLGLKFLPSSARRPAVGVDVPGIVLLGVMILSAMLGITYLGGGTAPYSPTFLVPMLIAAVAGWAFLRHTDHAPAPFISRKLLRGRGFGVMNVINFLYGAGALGFGALVPLYAQDRFDIHVVASGTLLTARAVGMICVAGLAVLALRRTGYRLPMIVGFLIVALGMAAMAVSPPGVSAYVWLSLAAGVAGIGTGMSSPASNNATLQLAPTEVAAIAGLRGMFRRSGSIVAISISTAVVARSADPGMTLGHIFIVFAMVLVCVLPLILLVPEHRGSW